VIDIKNTMKYEKLINTGILAKSILKNGKDGRINKSL